MQIPVAESSSVRIARSTNGCGLFAERAFQPKEAVGRVHGREIHDDQYSSDHCMDLTEEVALEPYAPFRYLNHGCWPNCELVSVTLLDDNDQPTGEHELWVEAIRAIAPDDELTIDYGWPAESAIHCRCGSDNCRGWIVADEQLDQM